MLRLLVLLLLWPGLSLAGPFDGPNNLADNTARSLGIYNCLNLAGEPKDPTYCRGITNFSGMKIHQGNQRIYMWGGGHATTFRDDTDEFWFSDLQWGHGNVSTTCAGIGDAANWNVGASDTWFSSGNPASKHSYDLIEIVGDEFIMLGPTRSSGGSPDCLVSTWASLANSGIEKVHTYNVNTRTWLQSGEVTTDLKFDSGGAAAEFDPKTGMVILVSSSGLWIYDAGTLSGSGTKSLTHPKSSWAGTPNTGGAAANLEYFPPTDKFYFFRKPTSGTEGVPGTGINKIVEITLPPGRSKTPLPTQAEWATSTAVNVTALNQGPVMPISPWEHGLAYDSVNQLIVGWPISNHIWGYNPTTKLWTDNTVLLEPGTPAVETHVSHHNWEYSDVHNVHIFITGDYNTKRTYAYRWANPVAPTTPINVGTLVQDGPATPEQIALYLPIAGGPVDAAATATVRYRTTVGPGPWRTGHPLLRIQPTWITTGATPAVPVTEGFAWPIIDLQPGTSYDVEVTVTELGNTVVKTLTTSTRALPGPCAPATAIIPVGATTAQVQTAINALTAGQTLQFANGTHTMTGQLTISENGTRVSPICIRGESRAGAIIKYTGGRVISVSNASWLIFENLTVEGNNLNLGGGPSYGFDFFNSVGVRQVGITFRNLTVQGVDKGINAENETDETLIYDTLLDGNDSWTGDENPANGVADIDESSTWDDHGIQIPGLGNVAFNNTVTGFGDSLSACSHAGSSPTAECRNIHFYRNDIRMSGDDGFEADHAFRNVSAYDNRFHNAMTFMSVDPVFGGPLLFARNTMVNVGRPPFKLNDTNTGHFIYNNLIIKTLGESGVSGSGSGWLQVNNGSQRQWGYRNNILLWRGGASFLLTLEPPILEPLDFTNNAWFPNNRFSWSNSGGTFTTLALAQAGLPNRLPVFSGTNRRHLNDVISESDPFVIDIPLGVNHNPEFTNYATPILDASSAIKHAGAVLPNITDGFTGAAPDVGPLISGRAIPAWGDRTIVSTPVSPTGLGATVTGGRTIQ